MGLLKTAKTQIKNRLGISYLVETNQMYERQLYEARRELAKIGRELVDYRLKLKAINHEKINVVFVCHRPAVWESLHSVYDTLKSDSAFNVYIVAIPHKKQLPGLYFNHEVYESEGAEDFWKSEGCINGYNYESGEWFDLKKLEPDYIFFQQPYNITRCEQYKSWNVAKYAKICYVAYAFDFIGGSILEVSTPKDFMDNVSIYFTQNKIDDRLIFNLLKKQQNDFTERFITGFPRYDGIMRYNAASVANNVNCDRSSSYKVIWTPRWCTDEGNCSFFDYKDRMVDFFNGNGEYQFVFRPHPQAFLNLNQTGELSNEEAEKYKQYYKNSMNMYIDENTEYFSTFFGSDCLISDVSSIMADYFLTGKPIIYCHKKDMFNECSKRMSDGFYWVESWEELQRTLEMLKNGKDPLKNERLKIIKELEMIPEIDNMAAERIKNIIINDADANGGCLK